MKGCARSDEMESDWVTRFNAQVNILAWLQQRWQGERRTEKKTSFRLENVENFSLMNRVQRKRLKLEYQINIDKSSLRA